MKKLIILFSLFLFGCYSGSNKEKLSSEELFLSAENYCNNSNYNEAVIKCTQAINIDNSNYKYFYLRGLAFLSLDSSNKAIADFTSSIQLKKNFISAYYQRGMSYTLVRKEKLALNDYSFCLHYYPKNSYILWECAFCYNNLGKYKESAQMLEKCYQNLDSINEPFHMAFNAELTKQKVLKRLLDCYKDSKQYDKISIIKEQIKNTK